MAQAGTRQVKTTQVFNFLLACLVSLLASLPAHAQSDYLVKKIAVTEGLSNGRIFGISKDTLGYMWFGTANGMTRYSGSSFKKYLLPISESFSDPGVLKFKQSKGRFFALMQGGAVYEYDYIKDSWQSIVEIPGERFLSFELISESLVLIGTTNGVYLCDLITRSTGAKLLSELNYVRKIHLDNENLYLSSSKGIYVASITTEGKIILKDRILEGEDILDFELDTDRTIWIGTDGNGLFAYRNGMTSKKEFVAERNLSVRDITLSEKDKILLAVDRKGLYQLSKNGEIESYVFHDPDDDNSISQNSINTIFQDDRGVIWMGIGEIGLNLLYERSRVFEQISRKKYSSNTIHSNVIRAIYQDDKGTLWIGTEHGLSSRSREGNWINYSTQTDDLSVPILSIAGDQDQLILGTYGEGLLRMDTKTGKVQPYNEEIKARRIYAIFPTSDGLWVGGIDGGQVYQLQREEIIGKFRVGQAKTFVQRNDHEILVGCVEGVYVINPQNGQTTGYTKSTLPLANIYALLYQSDGDILWIGNDSGLIRLNFTTGEATLLEEFSLFSGAVYSILEDEEGYLWIAAEKGLFNYALVSGWYRSFTKEDGQNTEEFGFGARARLKDGRLAFGGPAGAVLLDPEHIFKDQMQPAIHIAGYRINGSSLANGVHHNLNYDADITLDYNENTLEFEVDYIKFHGNKDYRLEWNLEGFDKEPHFAHNASSISYRNLPSGKYLLTVSLLNADGIRSANTIEVNIEILRPYWFRWWAFLTYLGLISAFVYILVIINRERQERKIGDEKIKFFIDVAHDIRTPVSLIKLASDQLLKKDKIEDSVQIIQRYTRNLNEYVTELLDFQKSERNMLRVLVTQFDLVVLLREVIEDFQPMSDQKSIDVKINLPEDYKIWGDRVQLGRIFTNLISNAIKYNHEGGNIEVNLEEVHDSVRIKVSDTGLGIPKGQLDKIFTRFHRAQNVLEQNIRGTGIGLILSKRLAELHHGQLTVESEENVGSTFTLTLRLGKSHFNPVDIKEVESSQVLDRITETNIKSKKSILVIEDNEDILGFIKTNLSRDYFVLSATDGKDGLFQIFEHRPDVVITDVMLPSMNGKEICHIIKNDKSISGIPVIILTALTGLDDKIAGLEVGADYYIEKPFEIEELRLAVKNLLKRSQLDQEIKQKSQSVKVASPEESFLSGVIEIINANITNHEFAIDDLCDELGLSRSNLFRKMKAIAGMSPSDLIQEIKLNRAKQMLKDDPNVRIDDVAYKCGFNDPKYFSTLFKKHFKKTPTEFQAGSRAI